jgi:hypothetical protein
VLGLSDLNNPDDPEGRAIAVSYRAYLSAILFYSWRESQDGIFRCGSLTDAGKVALSPMS